MYLFFQSADGGSVNCLIGSRFTSVRFQDNADIRTNQINLSSEEYNRILFQKFGIAFTDQEFNISETIFNNY